MTGMRKILLIGTVLNTVNVFAATPVTPDNYARAEVDESFKSVVSDVGANTFRQDKYLKSENSNLNNRAMKFNNDDTVTVHSGQKRNAVK
ncbi:hypothetical protein M5G20_13575 [Pseudomonas sp. TNT2022 ID1044]|uniref:hypothetical protein n=1 Tax=Pseudomonas sp. TNT2022 ID1044 TaxID=2942636 RepID=UPI002362EBA7|nr:hypothetical protein [Pseudomonas sp. TNT2022 ID1044]MDD0996892.1 hypothetical protein [Pseudomonas sp. TNT2022 ID1044]